MGSETKLARLQKIDDLRGVWDGEASDFTPWLTEEDNIKLLGDTLQLELEVEAQEQKVGRYQADILCKDTATEQSVLIENQLGRTDHSHLGQLLTYASGLDAATIVWIAREFTDEHRATLDWLNDIVGDNVQFFGVEIELWRISDSDPAPKFNVVSKPNDWAKSMRSSTPAGINKLQLEFWTDFAELLNKKAVNFRKFTARGQQFQSFSIGRTHFSLFLTINSQKNQMSVYLKIKGEERFAHFFLLRAEQEDIEREFGQTMDWRQLPAGKESQIKVTNQDCDLKDQDSWSRQQEWLLNTMETFHKVFAQRIRDLDASEYSPEDEISS